MSTMLRYAAMTLLSKTLQTFLYKYLVDIDVESVAMPSLMDAEDNSGWGVKLSNVRLREGVELMDLPGKRHVRKKKPQQQQQQNEQGTNANKSKEPTENGHAELNGTARTPLAESQASTNSSNTEEITEDDDHEEDNNENNFVARARLDSRYSLAASECSSGPPTPKASTSNWTCFKGSGSEAEAAIGDDRDTDGIHTPVFASPRMSPNEDRVLKEEDYNAVAKKLEFTNQNGNAEREIATTQQVDAAGDYEPSVADVPTEDEEQPTDNDTFTFEQDMTLRLGTGGRIGTLNVRLVGKELYVFVEDAFLVVEAVPKSEEGADAAKEATTDGETNDVAEEKPAKPADTKKSKTTNSDSQTVADKVMKSSGIARALSTIPSLLLRDCRIRLVVRSEEDSRESGEQTASELKSDDTVVEVGVDFLSVTNGEDFLAHFGSEHEDPSSNTDGEGLASTYEPATTSSHTSLDAVSAPADRNQYLMKRIRTGKGPEGGIWLKIFPPGRRNRHDLTHLFGASLHPHESSEKSMWALHHWYASQQMCFFRFSGLDLRARIYLGKNEEVTETDEYYPWYGGNEFDEYTLDSMLFGVDYVAPGLSRPQEIVSDNADSQETDSGRTDTIEDRNGIQRFQTKSIFHRVGQGMKPNPCAGDHLPCEHCLLCWEKEEEKSLSEHPLDSATPMPGVLMHLSLNDPLEVNVDRPSLDVLGVLLTLFTKKSSSSSRTSSDENTEEVEDGNGNNSNDVAEAASLERAASVGEQTLDDAFPRFMQPETIQLMGVQIAKLAVRVHVMRKHGINDCGLSFCYWDILVRCITLDHQKLSCPSNPSFDDLRLDLGELVLTEYKGTDSKQLVSLGLPIPEPTDAESTATTSVQDGQGDRPAWPSTASSLLNIPAPLDTLAYESRERHGLQMRYVSVGLPETTETRILVNLRVGTGMIDKIWEIKTDVFTIIGETKKCLSSGVEKPASTASNESSKEEPSEKPSEKKRSTSLLKYKIQTDGGRVNPYPGVQFCVPLSIFTGQKSSETGFFIHSLLNKVEMQYGTPPASTEEALSLSQLAALPESVRMRILLCLNDLDPLEKALGVKQESNSFLRCRAVNKKIVRLAKKRKTHKHPSKKSLLRKSSKSQSHIKDKREHRQELLSQIMKLDDATLEDLLHTHHKMVKRRTQKAAASLKKQSSSTQ